MSRTVQSVFVTRFKSPSTLKIQNKVFIYQSYLVSIISVETFARTLHLVVAFSVINSVKRMYHLISKLMKLMIGWLLFMIPLTLGFGTVGSLFLSDYSASFRNLFKSCESLVVFGYLKPNDLRIETEKSADTIFLKIYHGVYGLTGKSGLRGQKLLYGL